VRSLTFDYVMSSSFWGCFFFLFFLSVDFFQTKHGPVSLQGSDQASRVLVLKTDEIKRERGRGKNPKRETQRQSEGKREKGTERERDKER